LNRESSQPSLNYFFYSLFHLGEIKIKNFVIVKFCYCREGCNLGIQDQTPRCALQMGYYTHQGAERANGFRKAQEDLPRQHDIVEMKSSLACSLI